MTVERYMNCGWFQRKRVIQGNYVYYTLEYHGKVKCSRCADYHWPLDMKETCKFYKMCRWYKDQYGSGANTLKGSKKMAG